MSVVLETTVGDIIVDLYMKERPNACLNFLKLCKIKYYNLCIFHKVERNFIAQTGDPTATGRGGESVFCHLYGDQAKYFDAELKPRLKHEKLGTLSMVNNGNNMNGSQFFLTLGENLTYLDEIHTVFGEVAEGLEVLLKINEAICDSNNRPYQDIRITHTVVLHDPYDDPAGLKIPDASPEPTREQLESNYIGADEEIDDTKGKSVEEIEEKIKESEAKARATILEMVGDIPDADVRPPENVLFVCKLNPVTTSEDLEIIFSRFGVIKSCEVIKDKKSGESLQYAFIEFEKEEDCENAYFKMDNVLIDDRRIHVDFSQSVSKLAFDMENKFSKGKSARTQNLVIKNHEKSDGYDMIFDMDGDPYHSTNKSKHELMLNKTDHKQKHLSRPRSRFVEKSKDSSNSCNRNIHHANLHKSSVKDSFSNEKYSQKSHSKHVERKKSSSDERDYSYSRQRSGSKRDNSKKVHNSSSKIKKLGREKLTVKNRSSSLSSGSLSPTPKSNQSTSKKLSRKHPRSSSNTSQSSDSSRKQSKTQSAHKIYRHDSDSSCHAACQSPSRNSLGKLGRQKKKYRSRSKSRSPSVKQHERQKNFENSSMFSRGISSNKSKDKHSYSKTRSKSPEFYSRGKEKIKSKYDSVSSVHTRELEHEHSHRRYAKPDKFKPHSKSPDFSRSEDKKSGRSQYDVHKPADRNTAYEHVSRKKKHKQHTHRRRSSS